MPILKKTIVATLQLQFLLLPRRASFFNMHINFLKKDLSFNYACDRALPQHGNASEAFRAVTKIGSP